MPDDPAPFLESGDPGPAWPPPAGPAGPAAPGTAGWAGWAGQRAGGPYGSGTPWQAPGPPAWQPPPVPPRKGRSSRTAWLAGSIAALAAALIAGSVGYVAGTQHSRIKTAVGNLKAAAAGPCPAGTTAPGPAVTSPAAAGLMARLLPMPEGAQAVTALKQGELSLDDYLKELYPRNTDEKQRLIAHCFQAAVHRTWQTPGGRTVSVWLIRFGTAADARSYTLSTEQADAADPANTHTFTVTGVADGMGIAQPSLDKYGNTLTHLLGDRGNVAIIIHLFVPARLDQLAAVKILQKQNARL